MPTHRHPLIPQAVAALAASAVLACSASVAAEPQTTPTLQVGEAFPEWELTDQFDETHRLPGDAAQAIVFSRSKQADESLSPVLESVAGERLASGKVIYLSDISRMPGLITSLFALPSLRDRDYSVVLIREEGVSAPLATREDCLVRYQLEQGRVVSRDDLCEPADVRAAF